MTLARNHCATIPCHAPCHAPIHALSPAAVQAVIRALLLFLLLSGPTALAQHAMHNMAGSADMDLKTMPMNDAVLATAPPQLMLEFPSEVRLVKLALRNAERDLLDIGFRYNPRSGQEFVQALPSLPTSDYYTVEWGTIDQAGTLTRGSFHFAFGADARPPSYYLDQMESMPMMMSPDYRLLGPGN